jgi:hypothetical protein
MKKVTKDSQVSSDKDKLEIFAPVECTGTYVTCQDCDGGVQMTTTKIIQQQSCKYYGSTGLSFDYFHERQRERGVLVSPSEVHQYQSRAKIRCSRCLQR